MSDQVRWGVLGTAAVAEKHFVPAVEKSPNSLLGGVASRDPSRAVEFADGHGFPKAYGSYDELLNDDEIDAVYVPLPISLHAEWGVRCAEAGKPTLCEKPLAGNAEDARRMVEAFEQEGVPLAEGLMYLFHPLAQRVLRMVEGGAVGEVRVVNATFCCLIEDEEDIRFSPETGGGALLDVGSYCVSVMRHVTGQEPSEVAPCADVGEGTGVDESLAAVLKFPSGAVGTLSCSLVTEFASTYDIYGTEGRIYVPQGVVPNPGDTALIRRWDYYEPQEIGVEPADQWQLMVEDFADAVLKDRPPRFSPGDAVKNLEVIDRVFASLGA